MEKNWWDIIVSLLPTLITACIGIITVTVVRKRMDQHQVLYSGIFKEKIEVYRKVLSNLYDYKRYVYTYFENDDYSYTNKVHSSLYEFYYYYLINRPYLSPSIFSLLETYRKELSECSEHFQINILVQANEKLSGEKKQESSIKALELKKKFEHGSLLNILEDKIVEAMTVDLGVNKL